MGETLLQINNITRYVQSAVAAVKKELTLLFGEKASMRGLCFEVGLEGWVEFFQIEGRTGIEETAAERRGVWKKNLKMWDSSV